MQNRTDDGRDIMDELYGNNSLCGYQQHECKKEEREKTLIEVVKDKLNIRKRKRGQPC